MTKQISTLPNNTHLIVHGGDFVIDLGRWASGVVEAEHGWRSAPDDLHQEVLRQATVTTGLADHLQLGVVVQLTIPRCIWGFWR